MQPQILIVLLVASATVTGGVVWAQTGSDTYAKRESQLSAIGLVIVNGHTRLANAETAVDTTITELAGLVTDYADLGTAIDAALLADPGNAALLVQAAAWGEYVSEFTALKGRAEAVAVAIDAVP